MSDNFIGNKSPYIGTGHLTAVWGGITGTLSNQTDLDTRLKTTEEQNVYFEIFDSKSTASGTASIPTQGTVLFGRYPNGIDALCLVLDTNGRPLDESARETDGTVVTVSTFDASGNYTLSGTPSPVPFGIVYQIKIQLQYSNNVPENSIIVAWQYEGVEVENNTGYVYISGNSSTNGSIWIDTISAVADTSLHKNTNGAKQLASMEFGADSVWLGQYTGVAAYERYLAAEHRNDNTRHLHPFMEFSTSTGTQTHDAKIVRLTSQLVSFNPQPDFTNEWSGTTFSEDVVAGENYFIENWYVRIGFTAPTSPVTLTVRRGGSSGTIEFQREYPTTQFSPNNVSLLECPGTIGFRDGETFNFTYESTNGFSISTNFVGLMWQAYDAISFVTDDMLQVTEWVSGATFTVGQWAIQDRKIYICNTAGVQAGTFASNIALWDVLATTAVTQALGDSTTKVATTAYVQNNLTSKLNSDGYVYINGDGNTDGSRRFAVNTDTSFAIIEKLISGIWQPTSLQTGSNSLWVGLRVGIAAAGHHIITEDSDGHFHFHAHAKWSGQLSTSTARIIDAYNYETRRVLQPDNTGVFSGTNYEFAFQAGGHVIVNKAYIQTDTTISTTPTRMRVWEGTDDTGPLIFDQYYPASDFAVSSENTLITNGYLEFLLGDFYFFRISSDETFTFKANAALTFPWFAFDASDVHEDDMLQTTEWVSGDNFALAQWSIQNRKIYKCNTAGIQTGTFSSNSTLWDDITDVSPFWTRSGTNLIPKTAGDNLYSAENFSFASAKGVFIGGTTVTAISSGANTNISGNLGVNISSANGDITLTTDQNDIILDPQGIPGNQGVVLQTLNASSGIYLDANKRITNTAPALLTFNDVNATNIDLTGGLSQPMYADETSLVMDFHFGQYGDGVHQLDSVTGLITTTIAGTPLTSATIGKYGEGITLLTGEGLQWVAPDILPVGNTARTLECWMKPTTLDGTQYIFGYGVAAQNQANYYGFWGGKVRMALYNKNYYGTEVVLTVGEWHHVIFSYDPITGAITVYVNNVAVVVWTGHGGLLGTDRGNAVIGGYFGAGSSGHIGEISQLKMYNRAFSEAEVGMAYRRNAGQKIGRSVVKSDNFKIIDSNNDVTFNVIKGGNTDILGSVTVHGDSHLLNGILSTGDNIFTGANFIVNNGTTDIIKNTVGGGLELKSPDEDTAININNDVIHMTTSGSSRFVTSATDLKLYSPDVQNNLTLANTGFNLTAPTLTFSDGTNDRLAISVDVSRIYAEGSECKADSLGAFLIKDFSHLDLLLDSLLYVDGTRPRISINSTEAKFYSPDGNNNIDVADTGALYNGNEITSHQATEHDIFTAAQLTALATTGIITVSGTLTLNIKTSLASSIIYVQTVGSNLIINISEGVNYTYIGSGTLISGSGNLRIVGGVLIDSGTGTLLNKINTSLFQTEQITGCQLFGWALGISDLGNIFLRSSAVINHRSPLMITRFGAVKIIDFGFARLGSGAISDSIFEFVSGNENGGTTSELLLTEFTGEVPATDSVLNIHPSVAASMRATVLSSLIGTAGGTLFKALSASGTFSAVTDASIGATAITSVTDSSGIARFNYTGSTVYVSQKVVLSGFTETSYNGIYTLSAVGSGWFEIAYMVYVTTDTGSFLSNSVILTHASATLVNYDAIWIDTDLSTAYDVGSFIYNKTITAVQLNAVWSATATGFWHTKSYDEKSKYVEVSNSGESIPSKSISSVFSSDNTTATSITGTGTWDPLNLVAAAEGQSNLRFKLLDVATGEVEYVGITHFDGKITTAMSVEKTGSAVDYKFRAFKTSGTGAFDAITVKRGVSTVTGALTLISSVELEPGDQFRIEVETQGATNDLIVTDYSMVVE